MTHNTKQAMRRMRDRGYSVAAIADRHGVSLASVRDALGMCVLGLSRRTLATIKQEIRQAERLPSQPRIQQLKILRNNWGDMLPWLFG